VDWVTPVGSGVVAVAGVVFGWATTVRGQRQTAELSRESNHHAQALARLSGEHSLALQRLHHEQVLHDRREQSYVEVATTVVGLSTTDAHSPDDLVRARVMVGLFAEQPVREAFEHWIDSFEKLRFALSRESASGEQAPASVRDVHSPRDMWRRQATDARLKEVDARDRLLATMAAVLSGAVP
jgi:hypothetical protein